MTVTPYSRRHLLKSLTAAAALVTAPAMKVKASSAPPVPGYFRIGVEAAFLTPEIFGEHLRLLAETPELEPGFAHFWETALGRPGDLAADLSTLVGGENAAQVINFISKTAGAIDSETSVAALGRLFDLGDGRINMLDQFGIDLQIVSLASPGVQVFDAPLGTRLAKDANDLLAQAVKTNPSRLAGIAAVAPQDPERAAAEVKRAHGLGLKGVIVNSHTKGEYLDDRKFYPLLEEMARLSMPLYLHPRTPSPAMLEPFTVYPGLAAATYGFNVETGLHALRMILGGVFDDFPELTVVLGHMGEGLPFWIDRVDNRTAFIATGPGKKLRQLNKKPSDYLRENFFVATSGMDFEPALMLAHEVVGPDRILFATDYPMENPMHMIKVLDAAPLTDADKYKIYRENAEKLFRLEID